MELLVCDMPFAVVFADIRYVADYYRMYAVFDTVPGYVAGYFMQVIVYGILLAHIQPAYVCR